MLNVKVFERELVPALRDAARHFPAVVLSGPRRAGKTFLLQRTFPKATYYLLEDPDVLARATADPRGWIEEIRTPAILDEIQNAPVLLPYIRSRVDGGSKRCGQWLLTGSQDFSLMKNVSESMTGRAAVFQLLPLSFRETGSWGLIRGGFPEVVLRPRLRGTWLRSYIQTYLERDVRALVAVRDLSVFRRFLALLASRNGQVLNKSDLAAPLGVTVPTITSWLSVLETTGHILLVQPFFENFGKRLIKSPKTYWVDSGLLCFLLGIESELQLERSPFIGSVFEGFVASEIVKNQINRGRSREIYFFRDEQGLEVDFVTVASDGRLRLVEAKWSRTITPDDARPASRLLAASRREMEAVIVHRGGRLATHPATVMPGVEARGVEEFLREGLS